jgi:two-component system, cell cycle sensor histidine kinase and response regulator CckA
MHDPLWVVLASVAPLVLGALVPVAFLVARSYRLSAGKAHAEVLGLKRQLTDAQKSELLGSMVAGIVHDLSNVSMAVVGHLDLALLQDGLDPALRRSIEAARAAADTGIAVMRSVLHLSRKECDIQESDLRDALRDVEGVLQLLLRRGIHLKLLTPASPVILPFNRAQVFQILMNLVVNARDALGEGSGVITVSLTAPGDHVLLEVIDTGSGIPEEVRPRIFDWQFTTKPEGHGTGLGLSIVAGIVKSMGGTLAVESRVGVGSTFTVTLPRKA